MAKTTVKPTIPKLPPKSKKAATVAGIQPVPSNQEIHFSYTCWEHYKQNAAGMNQQLVTARFFVPGSLGDEFVPVIHPSGDYLDLKWLVPDYYYNADGVVKGFLARWRGWVNKRINGSMIGGFRNVRSEVVNSFPDGQVVKIQRIKLPVRVKTDAFASCEGPITNGVPFPGYALEVHSHPRNDECLLYIFVVDMVGAKPPDYTKPKAAPVFRAGDGRPADDTDAAPDGPAIFPRTTHNNSRPDNTSSSMNTN
jgi:hypothetical protein